MARKLAGLRFSPDRSFERFPARAAAILDPLVEPGLEVAGGDDLRKARLAVAISLAISTATLLLFAISLYDNVDWRGLVPLIAVAAVSGLAATAQRIGMPASWMGHLVTGMLFIPCGVVTVLSAGQGTGALLSLLLVPLVAIVLTDRAGCMAWTAISLGSIGIAAGLSAAGINDLYPISIVTWEFIRFALIAIEVTFLASLAMLFDWLREQSLAEAREARDRIAESEARYRALAENAGDVVLELDLELKFTYVAPNAESVFGRVPAAMQRTELSSLLYAEDVNVLNQLRALLAAKDIAPLRIDFRLHHEDGHLLYVECSAKYYETDSEEARLVLVARDATALHQAERAVRRSERLSSIGTLTAGVAHQINNPIGVILAASQLAALSIDDGDLDSVRQSLFDVEDSAKRCGDIVRDLLRFSRDEETPRERVDLLGICQRACDLTRSYALEHGTHVSLDALPEPQVVEVNVVEIDQVFLNLLRNAIEAKPGPQGIRVRVEAGLRDVIVEVRDEGVGIDSSSIPHIFDPFYTTRLYDGGTGLGLSVAYGIIKDHDGMIDIESEPGKGTVIRVHLPLAGS